MSSFKYGLVVTAAVAAVAFLSFYNFTHAPARKATTTRVVNNNVETVSVQDLAPSECPRFAGEEFRAHRESYLQNLYVYQQMEMEDSSTDIVSLSSNFYARITGQLDSDPVGQEMMARLGEERMHKLAAEVALLVARSSGLPDKEYLGHRSGGSLVTPANAGSIPASFTPQEAFAMLGTLSEDYRITKFAAQPNGVRVSLNKLPFGEIFGMLTDQMGEDTNELMYGLVHDCALMFYQNPNLVTFVGDQPETYGFEMSLVVEDSHKDRYPLWVTLYFDEQSDQWWPYYVCRMSSVRAAELPRKTY